MDVKCARCKKVITSDDFICPHCGLILGDPVSYATAVNQKRVGEQKRRFSWRWMLSALLVLVLAAAVGIGAYFVRRQQAGMTGTTSPSTTVPAPTQTTAPLTVYTVQVRTEKKSELDGTCIHIYSGDQELYSSQVGSEGTATFVLPESDGYTVKLTQLPIQYQVNYEDVFFSFEDGQQDLLVYLEDKPVPLTIKFVNSSGEPIPGVGLIFYSSGEEEQQQVSDASGCCTFLTKYGDGNQMTHSAYITFVPNGYYVRTPNFGFHKDRLEFEIELLTYAEVGIDPNDVYTVRVVDEYGEPASNISLSVSGIDADSDAPTGVYFSGVTNMEGCFCFVSGGKLQWKVKILDNVDYYGTVFSFEEGSHELLLELDLHRDPGEKFTYTISFMDFSDQPIPGVGIAVPSTLDGGEVEYYTSDENGVITFQSTESNPSMIQFYINAVPDGYYTNRPDQALYSFGRYERSTFIRLHYDGMVNYTIFVYDDAGLPVPNAELYLPENDSYFITDEQGQVSFRMSPDWDNEIMLSYLTPNYKDYIVDTIEYGEKYCVYITIALPSEKYTYEVQFKDQETGIAVPGVQIAVKDDYFSNDAQFYTADENGLITFESYRSDPMTVYFYVTSCPDDYINVLGEYNQYSFRSDTRELTVSMRYDGKLAYKVYLKDHEGMPVPYTRFSFKLDGGYYDVSTDDQGFGTFRIYPYENYRMEKVSLYNYPDKYENYVVAKVEYGEDRCIYITIEPSPIPNQGGHDE